MYDARVDALRAVLEHCDRNEPPLFRVAQWEQWPEAARTDFLTVGLLRHVPVRFPIQCPYCGRCCPVDPFEPIDHPGATFTAMCDDDEMALSTVDIPRHYAQAWEPDWPVFIRRMHSALHSQLGIAPIFPTRLWQLGRINTPTGMRKIFIARGLWWPHDTRPYEWLAQPDRTGAIVLTFADPPPHVTALGRLEHLTRIPLTDCLQIVDGQLTIALDGLGEFSEVPPQALSLPRREVAYPIRVQAGSRQLVIHDIALTFSRRIFDVISALARLHVRLPGVWRSHLEIAEEAYGEDLYPDGFEQVIIDKIKAVRDRCVKAGAVAADHKFQFIETRDGEYRFDPKLVSMTFDPS